MGAEVSDLGQYSLDEPFDDNIWVVKQGVSDVDDSLITVFTDESNDREKRQLFQRYIKLLRSIRHPCVLHYLSSGEVSAGSYLVTERVTPLRQVIDTLDPVEVCAGLFDVLQGLSFLHERAGISHNNICMDSIYITNNGLWKIGGFEFACKFSDGTPEFLSSGKKYKNAKSMSPEEKEGKLSSSSPAEFGHTRDVYSFGVLSEIILEHLQELGDQTKTFELRIQDECLNPDPKVRPKLASLVDDRLFRNNFLYVSRFLQDITLKTDIERKIFFSDVLHKLLDLPEEVVARRLAQPLLCRFVLLDSTAQDLLIPHLMTPCTDTKRSRYAVPGEITPVFTEDIFKLYIIPELYKIFHCHDYHIRTILLKYFSKYVHLFDKSSLEEIVFPQVLLGVRDAHDDLAALSLRALADMIPILGRDVVIGGKSKVYFSTGTPKFDRKVHGIDDKNYKNSGNGMGNILLKDLAKLSQGYKHESIETDDDKERKKREREEKREEARRKREAKRIERQKNNQEEDNIFINTQKISPSDRYDDRTISSDVLQDSDSIPTYNTGNDYSEKYNGLSTRLESHDDHVIVSSNQNEDWSDWDEIPDDDTNISIDQSKSFSSDHSNSADFIGQNNSLKGTLKQSSFDENVHSSWTSEKDIMSETSNSVVSQSVNVKKGGGMSLKGTRKITPAAKKKDNLGSEFDIKSIEIEKQPVPAEYDFFSEMAPEIKTGNLLAELETTIIEKKGGDNSTEPKTTNNSKILSYQVADTETGDNWGEDLEWGDDSI